MRYLTLGILITLFVINASAHPSWGFIVDQDGTFFLVDLSENDGTLMCFDMENKEVTILATGFHAHSMHLGNDGHIYAGLNIWRQGEIEGEGHNYLIRINTETLKLDTLLFSDRYLRFFGGDISMSQDLSTVYYGYQNHIYAKTLPDEPTRKLFDWTFKRESNTLMDSQGELWIADTRFNNGTIYQWNEVEGLREYASNLIPEKPKHPVFKTRRHHIFYGTSFSPNQNPIITESGDRKALEVLEGGKTKLIYQSPRNWHPLMVQFYDGHYYVLENGYKRFKGFLGLRIQVLNEKLEVVKTIKVDTKNRKLVDGE